MSKEEINIEVCGIALISLDPWWNECETRSLPGALVLSFRVADPFDFKGSGF